MENVEQKEFDAEELEEELEISMENSEEKPVEDEVVNVESNKLKETADRETTEKKQNNDVGMDG
mgnify:CR=1 FL=1